MSNPPREEKSEKVASVLSSAPSRPLMLGNMSENQLNCFLSICRFEETNAAKIGESGVLATALTKEADTKLDFLNKNADLMFMEYFKVTSQIKIAASVPLNLPDSAIEQIKENKLEKLTVTPELETNSVKISTVDKDGLEKILVSGQENYFENNPQKNAGVGLNISGEHLSMSIPRSPVTIESTSSKTQGSALYKLSSVGADENG